MGSWGKKQYGAYIVCQTCTKNGNEGVWLWRSKLWNHPFCSKCQQPWESTCSKGTQREEEEESDQETAPGTVWERLDGFKELATEALPQS